MPSLIWGISLASLSLYLFTQPRNWMDTSHVFPCHSARFCGAHRPHFTKDTEARRACITCCRPHIGFGDLNANPSLKGTLNPLSEFPVALAGGEQVPSDTFTNSWLTEGTLHSLPLSLSFPFVKRQGGTKWCISDGPGIL
jgi:hypothetical protein